MKNYIFIMILMIILIFSFSCKRRTTDSVPITIMLDGTPNTTHSGLYLTLDKGYFTEEGLDVSIVQPHQKNPEQQVTDGIVEFCISSQENVLRARADNTPLISVAAILQRNNLGYVSLWKSGIKSPRDFVGKRYGSRNGFSEISCLKHIMKINDFDCNDITIISDVKDAVSGLGTDFDFALINWHWEGISAQIQDMKLSFIPLSTLDTELEYYMPIIVTNKNLIRKNPDMVKRFVRALQKGYEYCIMYPESTSEILLNHNPDLNRELVYQSQMYISTQYMADSPVWGYQKTEIWNSYYQWMLQNQLLSKAVKIKDAFSNHYISTKK